MTMRIRGLGEWSRNQSGETWERFDSTEESYADLAEAKLPKNTFIIDLKHVQSVGRWLSTLVNQLAAREVSLAREFLSYQRTRSIPQSSAKKQCIDFSTVEGTG
jgi:hypothetical protein